MRSALRVSARYRSSTRILTLPGSVPSRPKCLEHLVSGAVGVPNPSRLKLTLARNCYAVGLAIARSYRQHRLPPMVAFWARRDCCMHPAGRSARRVLLKAQNRLRANHRPAPTEGASKRAVAAMMTTRPVSATRPVCIVVASASSACGLHRRIFEHHVEENDQLEPRSPLTPKICANARQENRKGGHEQALQKNRSEKGGPIKG